MLGILTCLTIASGVSQRIGSARFYSVSETVAVVKRSLNT